MGAVWRPSVIRTGWHGESETGLESGFRAGGPDQLQAGFNKLLKPGDRVLIPRASIGNKALNEELSKVKDVIVDDIATYDTVYRAAVWFDASKELADPATFALFTSASGVRGFVSAYPDMDHSVVKAICIGEMTAAEAEKHGMKVWISEKATLGSLADRLLQASRELV